MTKSKGKKGAKMDENTPNIESPSLDLTPSVEATETLITSKTELIKPGYVFARLKSGKGGIVQLPAKSIGRVFKEDVWEILTDKKK